MLGKVTDDISYSTTFLQQTSPRCVYSTAPIVILDSPFSALDNKIANTVLGKNCNLLNCPFIVKCQKSFFFQLFTENEERLKCNFVATAEKSFCYGNCILIGSSETWSYSQMLPSLSLSDVLIS